jgi:hypothetical protein
MSYNKNTIRVTEVDATLKVLCKANITYTLEVLGSVVGLGMNDDTYDREGNEISGNYECRKLTYGDTVLMERMDCSSDCDSNDYFNSYEYKKGEEPETWELSVYIDEDGLDDLNDVGP